MAAKRPSPAGRRRHVPQRTCIVCREKREKRRLTRIVNNPDEGIIIDPTGKKNGRGAYVCDQPSCWEALARTQTLDHALKVPVSAANKAALVAQYQSKPQGASHA